MDFDPVHLQLLHELTDTTGALLEAPIVLTDLMLRTLAQSERQAVDGSHDSHFAAFDPKRLGIRPHRLHALREPVRSGGAAELGVPGFWVMPVELRGKVAGLLWALEDGQEIRRDLVEHASRIATATLAAIPTIFDVPDAAGSEAAPFDDGSIAFDALVRQCSEEGRFNHDGSFAAIAVSAVPLNNHYVTRNELAHVLRRVVTRTGATYPGARSVTAASDTEAVLIVAPHPQDSPTVVGEHMASFARDLLFRAERREVLKRWNIGRSYGIDAPEDAGTVAWKASQTAELGLRMGWHQRTIDWTDVSPYALLAHLPDEELRHHLMSREIARFLEDDSQRDLAHTLERYLDLGGNVQAVADELFLHRASIYHRLRRIEAALDVDLRQGRDRLRLHTAVIAWRLLRHELPGVEQPRPALAR